MEKIFLIVEGQSDVVILNEILNLVLPHDKYQFHFYAAGGYYNAVTSVRPIMDLVSHNTKVLLIFDADTNDPSRKKDRIVFVKDFLGYISQYKNFSLFVFTPNIDNEILGISEDSKLKRPNRSECNEEILKIIRENIDNIRKITVIEKIIEFIKSKSSSK